MCVCTQVKIPVALPRTERVTNERLHNEGGLEEGKGRHILGLQIISLFCRITKIPQVSGKLQNHEMACPRVRGYVRITSFDISFII